MAMIDWRSLHLNVARSGADVSIVATTAEQRAEDVRLGESNSRAFGAAVAAIHHSVVTGNVTGNDSGQ